ncbi:MAG: FGGY family carbohydrate kinase, partial [Acidimicrobiales bacterium]
MALARRHPVVRDDASDGAGGHPGRRRLGRRGGRLGERLLTPLLLGVDIGTSTIKALLLDADGAEVAHAAVSTPFVSDRRGVRATQAGGRVEMAVDDLRAALEEVVRGLDGEARRRVSAVGIAGQAESGAPLDAGGKPLAPVIGWHDGRGEEAVRTLERALGPDLALRIGQPVRTVLTAAKLGWLVDHGIGRPARWLGVPELCLHALTGAEATEHSLAARTGCYDVGTREWIPEVADALGFGLDLFPPVRPAGAVMGRTSWPGLPDGVPVTIAGHDHLAGMAGAAVGPHRLGNSVGTAETVVRRSPVRPDRAEARRLQIALTVYPGGREWAALVSGARAGIVLDTAAVALGHTPPELDRLAATAAPVDLRDAVDALAHGEPVTFPDAPPGAVWAGLLDALSARTADACVRMTQLLGPAEG